MYGETCISISVWSFLKIKSNIRLVQSTVTFKCRNKTKTIYPPIFNLGGIQMLTHVRYRGLDTKIVIINKVCPPDFTPGV